MYQIFNTTLHSDFQLTELPQVYGRDADFRIKLCDEQMFDDSGFELTFKWFDSSGNVNCWVERRLEEYLFVFPGYVRYCVDTNGTITCVPHESCSLQTVRHLLYNQVIPRVLATKGNLVLHASAVKLQSGRSYAFLGNSGFGKSTLASSFHSDGARLISDDCILLQPGSQGFTATGGMPGIRLFSDSMHAVFNETTGFSGYTPYTDKQQLLIEKRASVSDAKPCPIDAIFLLNDPKSSNLVDKIAVTPVGGGQAMAAMINCSFSLDPSDRAVLVNNFKNLGKVINERLVFYNLSYPRDLSQLDLVKTAISAI